MSRANTAISGAMRQKARKVSESCLKGVIYAYYKLYYKLFCVQPSFIADMSWDVLIVLDACRFDVFKQINDIPGKLSKIVSAGGSTPEWMVNNFSNRDMKDVVYVSANPWLSYYCLRKKIGSVPFYKIIEVWKDCWNDELDTVHPSAVNHAALKSLRKHPDKRHIIHYLQPHHPFIGDVKIQGIKGWEYAKEQIIGDGEKKTKGTVWDAVISGKIDISQVWQAYISNLKFVLRYVKMLLPRLVGKVCITSDHGNLFGKFGIFYGHVLAVPMPELIEVPWFEAELSNEASYK